MKKRIALILSSTLIVSCTRTTPITVTDQPAPSGDYAGAYRATIEAAAPGSLVGVVNAVLPEDHFASFGGTPTESLAPGQLITFVDGAGQPVVTGTIVKIVNGNVHVKYEEPQTGRRSPREGDLAVWLKK